MSGPASNLAAARAASEAADRDLRAATELASAARLAEIRRLPLAQQVAHLHDPSLLDVDRASLAAAHARQLRKVRPPKPERSQIVQALAIVEPVIARWRLLLTASLIIAPASVCVLLSIQNSHHAAITTRTSVVIFKNFAGAWVSSPLTANFPARTSTLPPLPGYLAFEIWIQQRRGYIPALIPAGAFQ